MRFQAVARGTSLEALSARKGGLHEAHDDCRDGSDAVRSCVERRRPEPRLGVGSRAPDRTRARGGSARPGIPASTLKDPSTLKDLLEAPAASVPGASSCDGGRPRLLLVG